MTTIELDLPWPPSVNESTRRYHLKGYRAEVAKAVMVARWPKFNKARLSLYVVLCAPNNRRIDLDNRIKPMQDALKKAGVYDDDSQIDHLEVARGMVQPKHPCAIVIIKTMLDYDSMPFGNAKDLQSGR